MDTATRDAAPVDWDRTFQPNASDALRRAIANDELGHAFLFVGPPGVGQHELVRTLIAAVNCEGHPGSGGPPDDGSPCGSCDACGRAARGTHTALTVFEPKGANHLVGEVRDEWIPLATRSMTEGRRRVIRIVAADRMNETAQNAFLKMLEEPPPSTVWVLEAEDDQAMLDTILSRCRRLDLRTWGPQALGLRAAELDVPEERRDALVRAATGSPDRLSALAARECGDRDCGRVYVAGEDGLVPSQCLHHPVTCVACGAEMKGPPRSRKGRRAPCDCDDDTFDPSTLQGVATVPERARGRHLDVVDTFAADGPKAVTPVVQGVMAWARDCAKGLADEKDRTVQRLCDDHGVEDPDRLPRGVMTRLNARYKRRERETVQAAVDRFLDDLGSWARDLLLLHAGGADRDAVNVDRLAELHRDVDRLPVAGCLRALADINRCRQALGEFNGSPELQLERILHPVAAAVFAATRR